MAAAYHLLENLDTLSSKSVDQMMARLLLLFLTVLAVTAHAAERPSREAASFDRPVAAQLVPAKSANDPAGEIRCTYYADLMVREAGTDTPAPGAATIVPGGVSRPPCNAEAVNDDHTLKTEHYSFAGRKGAFLFFIATDPHGAIPFMLLDAVDGHVIFRDAKTDDGFKTITPKDGALRMQYVHGVNGSCSVYKEGPSCWTKLITEGKIPRALSQMQPSTEVCAAAYRRANATSDNPSVISYDVDVTVKRAGKPRVNSRGKVGCHPLP
jgi:hypothetical protein